MRDLDDLKSIKQLDQGHSYESISGFASQCEDAWFEIKHFQVPSNFRNFKNILFCGMGGSAYGARIIKSLYGNLLKIPVDLVSDYHLPSYADRDTLIIAASYSGNTEETISVVREALKIEAKIIGVTTGGELRELLLRYVCPVWQIIPKHNPSQQPRLAQGYMQMGQIAILNKLGILRISETEVEKMIDYLSFREKLLKLESKTSDNPAKELAVKFCEKEVNIIGGEFLEGALHAVRNPFHETAKHFANYYVLPELNHHLMEGLSYPSSNRQNLIFWLINSPLYKKEIKRRLELTREVIEKNSIEVIDTNLSPTAPLTQVFELIQLGNYLTFYLSMLHGHDPANIPWVNFFKEKLKEGENYEKQ